MFQRKFFQWLAERETCTSTNSHFSNHVPEAIVLAISQIMLIDRAWAVQCKLYPSWQKQFYHWLGVDLPLPCQLVLCKFSHTRGRSNHGYKLEQETMYTPDVSEGHPRGISLYGHNRSSSCIGLRARLKLHSYQKESDPDCLRAWLPKTQGRLLAILAKFHVQGKHNR